jgi:hypothetical protein
MLDRVGDSSINGGFILPDCRPDQSGLDRRSAKLH